MFDNVDEIDIISLKIIEKNDFLKAARQAKERKEELSRVLHRVENIYGEFEKPPIITGEFSSLNSLIFGEKSEESTNVEIVKDMPALEQLLFNYKSRQKYLQQVTVFIVGYSQMANDRLKLMQEVNQFFINSEDMFDSFIEREDKVLNETIDETNPQTDDEFKPTFNHPEEEDYTTTQLEHSVQDAIDSCKELTNRLSELNNDMIECFVKYTQNKAGNNKGRKKLEKALESALNESTKLNEKLAQSMKVISEKDLRIENLVKQCESKSKEVQKYKTAAESIKKTALESEKLKEQVQARDIEILNLQSELAQCNLKIEQTKELDAAQRANIEETAREYQEKCKTLERLLEEQKIEFEEAKRNMKRQQAAELKQIQADNEHSLQQVKVEHNQEIHHLKEFTDMKQQYERKVSSEFDENAVALQWSEPEDDDDKLGRQSSGAPSKNDQESLGEKSVRHSGSAKLESRQKTNTGSDRSSGKDVMTFNDAPDLDNEEFWSNVPRNHLVGRFSQYRQITMASMSNLLDDIETLQSASTRQIHSLKSQHQLHNRRWEEEREMLIEAVRMTEEDQRKAQNCADLAMKEIENFVSLMKLDESESSEIDFDNSHGTGNLGLVERVQQIEEFLKKHDLLKDPVSKMLDELMRKCQLIQGRDSVSKESADSFDRGLVDNSKSIGDSISIDMIWGPKNSFQERTRISVPKFVTMLDLHRNSNQKQMLIVNEIETNNHKPLSINTSDDVSVLDENKDIPFPEEYIDETGKRSVAISASPTLVRIAFYNDMDSKDNKQIEVQGVTAKDLEIPSGMIDIQDQTGLSIIHHPIVTDYLHSYDQILTFKERFSSILHESDKSEPSDIFDLKNLNPVSIRSQNRIIPQIEEIGKSIDKILQVSVRIIERVLIPKKKPNTKLIKEIKSNVLTPAKGKQLLAPAKITNATQIGIILEECREMRYFVKLFKQSYQSKFDLINNAISKLRQMFAFLNKLCSDKLSAKESESNKRSQINSNAITVENKMDNKLPTHSVSEYDSVSIYFNRRHKDRNIKRMQQAILESDFPKLLYEEALEKMASYMEIPAKQLYVLVKKYLHKYAMDKIARDVKENQCFTVDTFKILNQMESSIEKKQTRYRTIQDYFRNERILRAKALLDTFEKIENESSIFMIKPTISNKSKNTIKQYIVEKDVINETDQLRRSIFETFKLYPKLTERNMINKNVKHSKVNQMWRPDDSVEHNEYNQDSIFESRLFEIDMNRMLLPLNSVSVPYSKMGSQGNESSLPPQIAVRTYVAVTHPTVVDIESSPINSKTSSRKGTAIASSPKSRMSRDLIKHIPLPPIVSSDINENNSDDIPEEKHNKENSTGNVC